MSAKRKAIVFDLEDNKKAKVLRSPHRVSYKNDVPQENSEDDFVSYMQPEVLTLPFMLELLEKSHVRSSSLMGKSKQEIQKLFLEHVTPKPQRHYKTNTRVGKLLSAMQQKYVSSQTPDWQKQVMSSSGSTSAARPRTNLASLLPASAATDRLKPPVQSLINTERKTIRLGSGGSVAAKDQSAVKSAITLTPNKASELDKIDLLLKPRLKTREDKDLKTDVQLNSSSKRIILNKNKEESVSKKLKITKEGSTKSDDSNSKASSSPVTPGKHSSVSWP